MYPDVAVFDRYDPLCAVGQQLPVMADQEHGLRRIRELLLEPSLAGDIEVVVRLVEQQDLGRTAQQGFENETFLLAAGQGRHASPAAPVVADSEGSHAARVPEHLGLIPARVAPLSQGARVP